MVIPVRHYKYDDLRKLASNFLTKYHPSHSLPVPIEDIAELKLNKCIVPMPGLLQHQVDAFVWKDLKTIVVDKFVYEKNLKRYRFTLAHELSHIILHKEVIQGCPSDSVEAHKAYVESIDKKTHATIEANADSLAGLILVPPEALAIKLEEASAMGLGSGFTVGNPTARAYMADWIADFFEVSKDVVDYRLCFDKHWPFKKRRRPS